jgi:type IV secretion system T-DNA border endonuclease VirD2
MLPPAQGGGRPSRIDGDLGGLSGLIGRARQLAGGYQPAVIKVVSYAHGVPRATATGQYIQREKIALETHDGRLLDDRQDVAAEIRTWSVNFTERAESQDVGVFRMTFPGCVDNPEARELAEAAIVAAFAGHRHAVWIDAGREAGVEAHVVAVMAGQRKERFRIREAQAANGSDQARPRRLDAQSTATLNERVMSATGLSPEQFELRPGATSHGEHGVTHRLNQLIERGPARDDRNRSISNAAESKSAAREWRSSLRSQSARDTMHLIVSGKAETDVAAFTRAVRAFLHDRFADHKFMFGLHTDKAADGHIHAHAIIAVRSESGQKLHPSRETFGAWRGAYAEHARAEGLKIVAIAARERASSQSYGARDKAIVMAADRPRPGREACDRAYAADPANRAMIENARQRIAVARTNPIRMAKTGVDRKVLNESIRAWRVVISEQPDNAVAKGTIERLMLAQALSGILGAIGQRVEQLTRDDHDMTVTSEQMVKDLRLVNEAVSRTTDLLEGAAKQQFREASARYLETLANRIDLQRAQERGVERLTRAEVEAIAGANAGRLVERANAVNQREEGGAVDAARLVDAASHQKSSAGIMAASQQGLGNMRAVVSVAEKAAAQQARDAAMAAEAARAGTRHPAQPLSQALIQTAVLARLRAEQEQIIREIEASESMAAQSGKGQRTGPKR